GHSRVSWGSASGGFTRQKAEVTMSARSVMEECYARLQLVGLPGRRRSRGGCYTAPRSDSKAANLHPEPATCGPQWQSNHFLDRHARLRRARNRRGISEEVEKWQLALSSGSTTPKASASSPRRRAAKICSRITPRSR